MLATGAKCFENGLKYAIANVYYQVTIKEISNFNSAASPRQLTCNFES